MSHEVQAGSALRLVMWKSGSRLCPFALLIGFTSVGFGHEQTEFFFCRCSCVDDACYLAGVNDQRQALVYDPASRNRTNQYFDLNMIVEENNGAFWIIRRN